MTTPYQNLLQPWYREDTTESKESTGNMDATKNTKDLIENKDTTESKDPIHDETEGLTPSSSIGVVNTATPPSNLPSSASTATPPLLVPDKPTGLHTAIEQWHDIKSLRMELETKMREFELCLNFEESSDDSITDDSASNEEADENNERNERVPPTMAQAKAKALLWQQRQLANMNRQRRYQKKGY